MILTKQQAAKTAMTAVYPQKVTLIEVGPRDGFQFEKQVIPTDLKIEIIAGLVEAGLTRIQVTSFVNPERVPQMADAEEVARRLPARGTVAYSALVLNARGVERARDSGLQHVEISISASDTHSRKNTGMPLTEAVREGRKMVELAQKYNLTIRAGIQCAFGCGYERRIPEKRVLRIAQDFKNMGIDALALADTTGMAHPILIKKRLSQLLPILQGLPLILHLHDTRGLGLVNVMAALECGVIHFDVALGGMGGCPFIDGTAGNIATEDSAYLLTTLCIETGIDISRVAACTARLEAYFGKRFSGKIHRLAAQKWLA